MAMEDFMLPFSGRLSEENRRVKLAQLIPWEMIEEIYARNFKNEKTRENICENPYLQYFLGLHAFETQPLFDASMMTLFRKGFTTEDNRRN